MGKAVRNILPVLAFTVFIFSHSSCWGIDAGNLVDRYNKKTTVQKKEFERECQDKKVSVNGVVADVKEQKTFDISTDTGGLYYTIVTEPQKSLRNNSYRAFIVYKDESRVSDINKGQRIEVDGKLLWIVDERLLDSVWIYEEDLMPEEKARFRRFLIRASY